MSNSQATPQAPVGGDTQQLLQDAAELTGKLQDTIKYAKSLEGERLQLKTAHHGLQQEKAALEAKVNNLTQELQRLKKATGEPAVIQKVASIKEDVLRDTMNFLEERALIDPTDREKIASSIKEDPNVALRLARQVAEITSQPIADEGGRGVSKSAFSRRAIGSEKAASSVKADAEGFGDTVGWLAQ